MIDHKVRRWTMLMRPPVPLLLKIALSCIVALFAAASPAVAQDVQSATVVGTVTDPTGAVIPNAAITITNTATNLSAHAATNAEGAYYIPFQPAGTYTLTIETLGFKKYVQNGIVLEIGQTPRFDVQLQIGTTGQQVEVTASSPLLGTDNAVVGGTVDAKVIHDVPMVQAKPQHLMFYTQGSQANNDGTYHILGLPSAQINFTIDGTIVKQTPRSAIGEVNNSVTPPVDALMEAQVWTTGIPAEQGHSAGGSYNMVTKSGTNEIHFTAEERYIRKNFLHRQIFNQAPTTTPFEYHNFDATLGGPIFIPKVYDGRNKTFFFLAFRLDYDHEQNSVTANVPTAAMLTGDFNFAGVDSQPIYDPQTIACTNPSGCAGGTGWTATQFPGNQIPLSRFDPVAIKFLSMTPYHLPNTAGGFTTTGPTNNYIANTHYLADKDGYLGRFDQQIRSNNKAYFRFAWNRYREQVGRENILYAWHDIDNTENSYGLPEPIDTLNLTLGDVHTFSPTVINEFRTAYQRRADTWTSSLANQGWAGILGIPGVGPQTFPGFVSTGGSSVIWTANPAVSTGSNPYSRTIQDDFEFADNVTKVMGLHVIKFGYLGIRMRENDTVYSQPSGVYDFSGLGTGFPFKANTGNSFASFLLGETDNAAFTSLLENYLPRWWSHQFFVQDDWRARNNLTISVGMRYSYETPGNTKYGYKSQFDPNVVDPLTGLMGAITHPTGTVYKNDLTNFEPRLGVAYNFRPRWVFRGSFDMFTVDNMTELGQDEYLATAAVAQAPGSPYPAFRLSQGPGSIDYSINPNHTANYVSVSGNYAGRTATYLDPNLRNPHTLSWSSGFQYQVSTNTIAEVVYQGSDGINLINPNPVNIDVLPQSIYNSTDTTLLNAVYAKTQAYLQYPQFGAVNEYSSWNGSTYHGLSTRVEKRYSNGFLYNFLFTWSKNITSGPGSQVLGGQISGSPTYTVGTGPEFYDRSMTKGVAGSDTRLQYVSSASYDIPVGTGRKWMNHGGVANVFLGGWTFLTIQSLRTGIPANFLMAGSPNNYLPGQVFPDIVSGQHVRVPNHSIGQLFPEQNQNPFFNISAFSYPAAFTNGNAGIGIARYGGVWWPQYSLTKTIAYRERYRLTVRMDANNLFPETHAFGTATNNVVNITSPQLFGKVASQAYSFSNWYTPNGNLVGVLRLQF
jgi:hypothetical protein